MRRETLLDFFDDFAQLDGPFLVHDDGYRVREYRYRQIASLARAFARRLREAGLRKGDALVIWSENRPEWIVALWGALLEGVVLVPIDFRASADFLWRVQARTQARLVLMGDDVSLERREGVETWKIRDLARDPEPGTSDPGPRTSDLGPRTSDPGPRTPDLGPRQVPPTPPRLSSPPAPPPSRRASSSPTATSWRTSSRSNGSSGSTASTHGRSSRSAF
jgi:acyl-CoA synthetase (AMP-forming)/AMP-acid ligase II